MSFSVLRSNIRNDWHDWIKLWQSWKDRKVFAHPAYTELFASEGEQAICAVWISKGGAILFPLIYRPLHNLKWTDNDSSDLVSPYGYGGPFCWGIQKSDTINFWESFDAWAIEHKIISLSTSPK